MLETYVLHTTKECNCNCAYCYEKDKSSIYEWSDIKQLLDDIIKYNKHFSLEFLGGEPCLRIDLIENTVKYLKSKPIHVEKFFITTNGTVINDELVTILKENSNVHWAMSIDGHKFMNCLRVFKDGTNTYDKAIENFKTLHKELNNDQNKQLSVHMVTHPFNIAYFNEGVNDLYAHGLRGFGIGTVESTLVIDEIYCNEYVKQLCHLSDRIKKGELPGINVGVLEYLKPKSDERHYIKDATGKTILETYGRVKDDIKDTKKYKTKPSSSSLGYMIYNIREKVYNYHNSIS